MTAQCEIWLYGGGGDFFYDRLLKTQMPAALASLEDAVSKIEKAKVAGSGGN